MAETTGSADTASTAERSSARSERRVVTVLFADLSGFTSLGEQLDPEELTAVLKDSFGELMKEVRAREGWLQKQIGDALLAVFGAPVTHEDDASRAVAAALGMQERMRTLNERLEAKIGRALDIHIGVNTGLVVVGPGIGQTAERGLSGFIVIGDTVNTAARLQQAAGPGQILVGEATYAATQWAFEYRQLPALSAKGKVEKVAAYECLRARPQSPARQEIRRIASPLLGREAELAGIEGSIDSLLNGRGGVAIVTGEAGLGKSRLMAEARQLAAEAPLRWLEGRALSLSQTTGYRPFLELIRSFAGITEEDADDEAWSKLEARLTALLRDEVVELLPYLATLLTLSVKGEYRERVEYLDAEAMGRQIFRSARRLFERLAQERPLVLVLEDWHWADEASTRLLEHLLPLTAVEPLLVVCVSRPEREGPAARVAEIASRDLSDRFAEIRLRPLSEAVSAKLVENLLAVDELPESVRSAMFAKTAGNPFFLEEIVRALIDVGAVVRAGNERWEFVRQVDEVAIPDTLRGVILARIDRLDEDLKDTLKIASVIGRSFFYRLLRGVAQANGKLDEHLTALLELELIRERRSFPELEYAFKHALTQEAIYESVLLERRRDLHRRVGQLTETLLADRLDEFYGLVAYHYARAEDWEKAQEYLFKAGDQAGRVAADTEALRHYEDALTAYARAFGDEWDPFQRAQLERKVGEALLRRGKHELAIERLHRALAYHGKPYPQSRWGVRLAIARELIRQLGHRLVRRELAARQPAEMDLAAEEQCLVYYTAGWIDFSADQERLVLDFLLQLNLAERRGVPAAAVRGSAGVGIGLDLIRARRIARGYHRRAVDLAEEIRHPLAIGVAFMALAIHEFGSGAWDQMLGHCSRSATAFRDAGEVRGWGSVSEISTFALRSIGDRAALVAVGAELRRVGEDAGDAAALGWGVKTDGIALMLAGDLAAAARRFEESIRLFEAVPDVASITHTMSDLGVCFMRQGELDGAIATLEESSRLIAEHRLRGFFTTQTRTALADGYLRIAEAATGDERSRALKKARDACRAAHNQAKAFSEGEPAAFRARGTFEWLQGKPRAARKWWQRSVTAADELGARYELGLTKLEIGRRLEGGAELGEAEAIFAAIGARRDLEATRSIAGDSTADRSTAG